MSKAEMDKINKDWEAQKAAELKAKLDMVTTRSKPGYGKSPRKIGEMVVSTEIKAGYRDADAKFVLRLDAHSGEFIAEHGDLFYVSKSREALQAKMSEVARITFDLKWTRYMEIEYKATVPYRSNFDSTTTFNVGDKRSKEPILGIDLQWKVVEYSNAIRLPGDEEDRYMTRDVDEDGNASSTQESVKRLPPGLVHHTKEREALLQSIRDAFGSIDKKMCELLKGSPAQVAKRLDAANGTLLLAAPRRGKS